jgi:hypothetical protein
MAKAKYIPSHDRFLDGGEEPRRLLQPIECYRHLSLVTIEAAVEPLAEFCPDVRRRAYIAKGTAINLKIVSQKMSRHPSSCIQANGHHTTNAFMWY